MPTVNDKWLYFTLQMNHLVDQLEQIKEKMEDKDDELQQMAAQLEISNRERTNSISLMEEKMKELESEREQLQVRTVVFYYLPRQRLK